MPVVASVEALDRVHGKFEMLGLEWHGGLGIPGRHHRTFTSGNGVRIAQLHFFSADSPHIQRHFAFREHLRAPWQAPIAELPGTGRNLLNPQPSAFQLTNAWSITRRAWRTSEGSGASKSGAGPLHPGMKMGDRAGGFSSESGLASLICSSVCAT